LAEAIPGGGGAGFAQRGEAGFGGGCVGEEERGEAEETAQGEPAGGEQRGEGTFAGGLGEGFAKGAAFAGEELGESGGVEAFAKAFCFGVGERGELAGREAKEGFQAEIGVIAGEGAEVIGETGADFGGPGQGGGEGAEEIDVHPDDFAREVFGGAGLDGICAVDAVAEEFLIEEDEAIFQCGGDGKVVIVNVPIRAEGVGAEVVGAAEEVAGGLGEICDAEPGGEGVGAGLPDGKEPAGTRIGIGKKRAVAVDKPEAGGDHGGGRVAFEAAEAGLDAGWLVEIVRVEDADEISIGGEGDEAVECVVRPGVFLGKNRDPGIGHRAGGVEGVIGGAVVNDDDAIWRAGLRKKADERIADVSLVIEEGDDDG